MQQEPTILGGSLLVGQVADSETRGCCCRFMELVIGTGFVGESFLPDSGNKLFHSKTSSM